VLRHATQIGAGYVAATGANRCRLGAIRDVAAARRTVNKTTHDALFLVRFAARFVTLDLAALRAELDGALGLGLIFAAIAVQQCPDKNRGHQDQQAFSSRVHVIISQKDIPAVSIWHLP
jgi:hypothetical protein